MPNTNLTKQKRSEVIRETATMLQKVLNLPQSGWDREDTTDLVYARGFLSGIIERHTGRPANH